MDETESANFNPSQDMAQILSIHGSNLQIQEAQRRENELVATITQVEAIQQKTLQIPGTVQ